MKPAASPNLIQTISQCLSVCSFGRLSAWLPCHSLTMGVCKWTQLYNSQIGAANAADNISAIPGQPPAPQCPVHDNWNLSIRCPQNREGVNKSCPICGHFWQRVEIEAAVDASSDGGSRFRVLTNGLRSPPPPLFLISGTLANSFISMQTEAQYFSSVEPIW